MNNALDLHSFDSHIVLVLPWKAWWQIPRRNEIMDPKLFYQTNRRTVVVNCSTEYRDTINIGEKVRAPVAAAALIYRKYWCLTRTNRKLRQQFLTGLRRLSLEDVETEDVVLLTVYTSCFFSNCWNDLRDRRTWNYGTCKLDPTWTKHSKERRGTFAIYYRRQAPLCRRCGRGGLCEEKEGRLLSDRRGAWSEWSRKLTQRSHGV